jgi:hypothetical protein
LNSVNFFFFGFGFFLFVCFFRVRMLRVAQAIARGRPAAAVRCLNIHEYQSKELMRRHGLSVQRGDVAATPEEAKAVADKLAQDAGAKKLSELDLDYFARAAHFFVICVMHGLLLSFGFGL